MPARRARAPRLDPETRRGLIIEAAERLLAEDDPLLVTFDQVAQVAGVSRSLVHTYLGDRRGLIDAVQVRIVARLDAWVDHGLRRADDPEAALRAITVGLFAFVAAERDGWSVLVASGGLDHPALHGVRARWAVAVARDDPDGPLAAQVALAALLGGVGGWVNQGLDAGDVLRQVRRLHPRTATYQMPNDAARTAATDSDGPS